ncbi:MAG: hypothetical protein JWR16_1776 [Nevskia sp.]|nr:hypothetical protein [Nevskia sp.]
MSCLNSLRLFALAAPSPCTATRSRGRAMTRTLLRLGLSLLALSSLPARAVDDCSTVRISGHGTPCNLQPDTGVKKEFFVPAGSRNAFISAKIVADDLGVTAPGYKPAEPAYYQVFVNKIAPNGRLLVFAPGAGGLPQTVKRFSERAAELGYHVVAMHYWDEHAADSANCKYWDVIGPVVTDGCITQLYEGLFRTPSALFSILYADANSKPRIDTPKLNDADPLQDRLRQLLKFLSKNFPDDGWQQFAPGGDSAANYDRPPFIAWAKVTLAGHSNGSKLMAYIARQVKVHRLIMLSGPNVEDRDASGKKQCPSSLSGSNEYGPQGATPIHRYYAYYSLSDPNHEKAESCFAAMGLEPLGSSSIYGDYAATGAHVLYNDVKTNTCDGSDHRSTVSDCAVETTPDSLPTYERVQPAPRLTYDVWDYLLGHGVVGRLLPPEYKDAGADAVDD